MTEEEVAQVIAYRDENKISYKQRLSELGINPWNFYDVKRRYAPKEEGEDSGEFLQLTPGGSFRPNPIRPLRSRGGRRKDSAQGTVAVSVELRTPTGTMLRISGDLTGRELKDIIIASSTMFSLERGMRYWLCSEPTDMRKSFHTLSGLVRDKIGGDPMSGDVYIFVNRRRNRIKLLHYETGGVVIYAKMLDRGTFGMPVPGSKDIVTSGMRWEDPHRMV